MFECLGWDRNDCIAEERLDGAITDYTFQSPQRVLILEAKREGSTFDIPVGKDRAHKRSISFFRKHQSAVYEAIEQCIRYCQERGTNFGVVSNGRQYIAFLASRVDGVPPLEGDGLVFPSIDAIRADFVMAWSCLSKDGVLARRLANELSTTVVQPPPPKLATTIVGYPGYRNRNPLQTELQILGDLVIEDIARADQTEEEFLRKCYSSSGALSQYALVSKSILEARYSTLFEKAVGGPALVPANTRKGIDPDLLAQSLSRRPILLVGDVGVGKTTFIRRLIKIDARVSC